VNTALKIREEITEGMAPYEPPVEIPIDRVVKEHKILYAIAKKAP
jgi:hypothetical protein